MGRKSTGTHEGNQTSSGPKDSHPLYHPSAYGPKARAEKKWDKPKEEVKN